MITEAIPKTVEAPEDEFTIKVSSDANDPEWDSFLANTPGGHHVQTSLWGRVKALNHWEAFRVIARAQGKIIGGAQVLFRSLAPLAGIAYLTKGPVVADNNLELAEVIIKHAARLCKQRHALLFAVQPANNGYEIAAHLPAWGFQPSALELAPVASLVLDLTPPIETILANMKRQTRQNIRRSKQAGMTVREGGADDLDAFYEFHAATSKRQGFLPYSKQYYAHMREVFEPRGHFKLFMTEWNGEKISGLLVISFGDTVLAKILGWSGTHPDLRPNDCLFWNVIQWSRVNNYRYFDFEGIELDGARAVLTGQSLPASLQHSPDFFKLGYGGQVTIFPAAFEMIPNPVLNWAYKKASPTVGGHTTASRLMDRLRKV